jgi:hypothetical protein
MKSLGFHGARFAALAGCVSLVLASCGGDNRVVTEQGPAQQVEPMGGDATNGGAKTGDGTSPVSGGRGGATGAGGESSASGGESNAGGVESGGAPSDAGGAAACAKGTPVPNVRASACHVSICDGLGHVVEHVDQRAVPPSKSDCTFALCDAEGAAHELPRAAGSMCQSNGGRLCDGAGSCVGCLTSRDCKDGQLCLDHDCSDPPCGDKKLDGDETDVDCGGSCAPCDDALRCKIDQDCASDACEPKRLVCLPSSCIDEKQDNDETDIDCGGSCIPCSPGGYADGFETDVDCGGVNNCVRCKAGLHRQHAYDCQAGLKCDTTAQPAVCSR